MSFYPFDFIFIGWIGYDKNLQGVPRNSDFKPTNPIFSSKTSNKPFSKMAIFGGVMSKIDFSRKWCCGYGQYVGFGSK